MDRDLDGGTIIGPDVTYEYYLWLVSPALWCGVLLLIVPFFLQDLFKAFPQIDYLDSYHPGLAAFVLGVLLLCAGFVISRVRYLSTLFVVKEEILYVKYGVITKVSNTVPLRFVYDCDVFSGPLEQTMGVKTLQVKVMAGNGGSYFVILRFIKEAEMVRDFLLQHSAVRNSNVVTAI
jgi:membrane protein YdbS with pleckstrin-like domain